MDWGPHFGAPGPSGREIELSSETELVNHVREGSELEATLQMLRGANQGQEQGQPNQGARAASGPNM